MNTRLAGSMSRIRRVIAIAAGLVSFSGLVVFVALGSLSDLDRRLWLSWLALSTVGLVGFTINFVAGGWAF